MLTDLQVFTKWVQTSNYETLDQQIALFNEATRGAIILRRAANMGDYSDEALWAKIANLVRRRNAYGSGSVTATKLSQLLKTTVKVAGGTPPIEIDPSQYKWILKNQEEAGFVIGRQLAEESMADMLNTGLMVAKVAIGAQANLVHDATAGVLSLSALNKGASKFGDRAGSIVCWIMHSTPIFDLYEGSLNNAEGLFQFGNVRVTQDGFGRTLVFTDSPALVTAGSPDTYHTLGLTAGSILVEQNDDFVDNIDTTNGDENIKSTYQAEWSYNLGLKGYAWDKANGGKSPNDAALGTATNWDKYATSDKDTAGVLVDSQ